MYVKANSEKDKAALLVLIAGLSDGHKVILTVQSGPRESTESWSRQETNESESQSRTAASNLPLLNTDYKHLDQSHCFGAHEATTVGSAFSGMKDKNGDLGNQVPVSSFRLITFG